MGIAVATVTVVLKVGFGVVDVVVAFGSTVITGPTGTPLSFPDPKTCDTIWLLDGGNPKLAFNPPMTATPPFVSSSAVISGRNCRSMGFIRSLKLTVLTNGDGVGLAVEGGTV